MCDRVTVPGGYRTGVVQGRIVPGVVQGRIVPGVVQGEVSVMAPWVRCPLRQVSVEAGVR